MKFMAGSVNSNYFANVNARFQTDLAKGDGTTAQNLKNHSGVTHTAKKTTVKKGGNIEEGSNLSEAARQQLKSEQAQHADHMAEHGHEMAQQVGIEPHGDTPEQNELRSKRGYEREQEELADGPVADGKVKLTSPEGKVQIMTVEDHSHLKTMDDPDVTDRRVLDDIPDANLNAANATLDTQMANGVSKVAVLKTDPKIDAVAETMHVDPLPNLVEPMGIVEPGNDKTTKPMPLEFPPEMEQIAAEKAARELASGDFQQEAILAGPGMGMPKMGSGPSSTPSRPTPEQSKANSAAANLLAKAPAGSWGPVAELLGVKPGQGSGVTPSGTPQEKQAQVMEWRVGHALQLEQAGHGGLALQTLSGQHDSLVGKDVLATTVKNDAASQTFRDHYKHEGVQLKDETFRPFPQDLHGQQVAFLAPDENGLLREVRGQVKASADEGSAVFELAGKPGQTFNNNYIRDLAVLPDEGVAPMPPVQVPPEALAAKPQNNRQMPRDEMLTKVAASATPAAAKVLFEAAGVKPGQGSGEDFKPGQVNQWRLGQAAQLAEANQGAGMTEVLSGKWDKLAGQNVQQHLEQRAEFRTGFQDHYRKNGAKSVDKSPHDLSGKMVAFLQENKDTGKLEEMRGVLQHQGRPGSAIFTLQGHPGVEFNSNFIESVVTLPNQGVPPFTTPEAKSTTIAGLPATELGAGSTVDSLSKFSRPLERTQVNEARSQLNERQKQDLEQLEGDVKSVRGILRQIGERPGDQQFATKSHEKIREIQTRIMDVAGRHQAKESNMQVILDQTSGEVFTRLNWSKDKVTPDMEAQGYNGVSYSLTSSPGRTDMELTSVPLKEGKPDGAYVKYRVASGDPKSWQGVAAVVGDVNGENGFHASTVANGDPTLRTHMQTDPNRMTASQRALAGQTLGDVGLTWPGGGAAPNTQANQNTQAHQNQPRADYQNQPGQPQQPVQRGFLDRLRYAFTGDSSYIGGPPPNWQAPPQPSYNYMGQYPNYSYPPVNYGGYNGYAGSWGGGYGGYGGGYGGGGMDTMMKIMMATSMISSFAMPMMYFANCMW
ncbi:hypothetical protein IV102_18855 [bacterium]|nr:hypothetical protein [bacterium]